MKICFYLSTLNINTFIPYTLLIKMIFIYCYRFRLL